jgi:uncharacterized protein (DUF58 family)
MSGFDPRVLRELELTVMRRLDGLLHGDYRGLLPGHGSEIGEARLYEPGDDVRRIDWSLTARTGQPHVRDTVVDRELETTLVIDLSASMAFGTDGHEKRDVALAIASAFGFLVTRGGNRVGALLLGGAGDRWVPHRAGRAHLFGILGRIQKASRDGGAVDIAIGLRRVRRLAGRRGLVIVVSDFIGAADWARPLQALALRHDVIVTEVVDRRELALPAVGQLTVVDPETGRRRHVDTGRPALRAAYAAAAAEQRASIARSVTRAGADHLRLDTSGDWLDELIRHVFWRRRRREAAGAPT